MRECATTVRQPSLLLFFTNRTLRHDNLAQVCGIDNNVILIVIVVVVVVVDVGKDPKRKEKEKKRQQDQ